MLSGILLNPAWGPSIMYISVPNNMHIIKTKRRNIIIFALLTSSDLYKKFDSPIYLDMWRTLNILSILKALIAIMVSSWAPINISDTYLGMVASKSIIP